MLTLSHIYDLTAGHDFRATVKYEESDCRPNTDLFFF